MNIKSVYRYAGLVFGLIYGLFFLLMSLDSLTFEWNTRKIEGFLIHASPAFIILLGAITGFRKPVIGTILFSLITVVSTIFFHTYREISSFMVISFPSLVVALLFMISLEKK